LTLTPDVLLSEMTLVGPANTAELVHAITEPPRLTRTIDGASTLEIVVSDARRTLLSSGALVERSYALVDGVSFELVAVEKAGDRVKLTFEDLIVASLRRVTSERSFAAGTQTWSQIVTALAAEAQVPALVEPTPATVNRAVERSVADSTPTDSWRIIADGSEDRGLRAFSDGTQLIVGSDDWLAGLVSPWTVVEHQGPVQDVDFSLDVARKDNSATIGVFARRWSVMPGRMLTFPDGMGPAAGRWLAESFERELTRELATVTAVRNRAVLPEPPPEALPVTGQQSSEVEGLLALTGIRETSPTRPAAGQQAPPENPRQADRQSKPRKPGYAAWAWPTYDKRVTSGFGPRKSPGGVGSTNHKGIDIGAGMGAQVFAARAGRVSVAGYQSGYGNVVYIDHGEGVQSRYAHLSQIDTKVGATATIGTQVGRVGSTGTATGPHLHFEIRITGAAVNPVHYLP
jgi:murein DD-endopeptidase MepM/ murein hydrolase activator NlpD